MLKKILSLIQDKTSWLVILSLLAVTLGLMFLMNGTRLPFSHPTILEHSGGIPILDIRLGFSPDDAYELFDALGMQGRRAYRLLHLLPDLFFPMGYSLVFAFLSAWFLVRLFPLNHYLQWLCLIPLVAGLSDWLENLSLVICSLSYPARFDWLVRLANLMNKIKFFLMPIGSVFLILLIILWFLRRRPVKNIC